MIISVKSLTQMTFKDSIIAIFTFFPLCSVGIAESTYGDLSQRKPL